jgi:tRNA1Val (adenine37-N6)-methyltransferase
MTTITHDSISLRGAGAVTIAQPRKGFRFTQDSILLADFCRIKPRDRILELGAGTGVISLLLAQKFPTARFVADEFEPEAYRLLAHNIDTNGFRERIIPVDRDVKYLSRSIAPGAFDVLVANPPYTRAGSGRTSPSAVRQSARQDRATSLPVWLNRHDLLKNKGRFFLVFPAHRAGELICLLRERTLEPKRLRFVHSFQDKPASLLLLEAVKAGGTGLEVLPPLIVHGPGGEHSKELADIYGCTP